MRMLLTTAILLTVAATPANALSDEEKGFVVSMTAGLMMATKCNAKVADGGMARYADKFGLDGDTLSRAVDAAIRVNGNMPYDRADLIPGATQIINRTYFEIADGLSRDKKKTCAKWIKALQDTGVLE